MMMLPVQTIPLTEGLSLPFPPPSTFLLGKFLKKFLNCIGIGRSYPRTGERESQIWQGPCRRGSCCAGDCLTEGIIECAASGVSSSERGAWTSGAMLLGEWVAKSTKALRLIVLFSLSLCVMGDVASFACTHFLSMKWFLFLPCLIVCSMLIDLPSRIDINIKIHKG